jgi:hypothetical protein
MTGSSGALCTRSDRTLTDFDEGGSSVIERADIERRRREAPRVQQLLLTEQNSPPTKRFLHVPTTCPSATQVHVPWAPHVIKRLPMSQVRIAYLRCMPRRNGATHLVMTPVQFFGADFGLDSASVATRRYACPAWLRWARRFAQPWCRAGRWREQARRRRAVHRNPDGEGAPSPSPSFRERPRRSSEPFILG